MNYDRPREDFKPIKIAFDFDFWSDILNKKKSFCLF